MLGSSWLRLVKDPLLFFLAAGATVFSLSWIGGEADDPQHIHVDLQALTEFVQHRSQLRDPEMAKAQLDGLSKQELQFVINAYVREEALYREAVRLGFGQGDYVIRRRLAQKIEFMADGGASALPPLDEGTLRDYFNNHRETYRQPPTLTFTHVFFDASKRGERAAQKAAAEALIQLSGEGTSPNDAAGRGDAFLYRRNYPESSRTELAGHFGDTMAGALFELPSGAWQGPLRSPYGSHLVFIAVRNTGGLPEFDEVRSKVRTDAEHARRKAFTDNRITELIDTYRVTTNALRGGVAKRKANDPNKQSAASNVNPD